jgi:hypothetical protein
LVGCQHQQLSNCQLAGAKLHLAIQILCGKASHVGIHGGPYGLLVFKQVGRLQVKVLKFIPVFTDAGGLFNSGLLAPPAGIGVLIVSVSTGSGNGTIRLDVVVLYLEKCLYECGFVNRFVNWRILRAACGRSFLFKRISNWQTGKKQLQSNFPSRMYFYKESSGL